MDSLLVVGLPILLVLGVGYFWYVSIISKFNSAKEALSSIDVQLQKRGELIPNILKIAKKFMDHEKQLLTEITELRTEMSKGYNKADKQEVQEHLAIADKLASRMGSLMVQVENYPDLKSDQTMVTAMQSYNEVEAQIAASRRFYNSSVTALNNSVEIFPGNIIAGIAGVASMPFYEAPAEALKPVDASSILDD
jgi:LemA protein